MAPSHGAKVQLHKAVFSPVHKPFTRPGHPFWVCGLWSLWIKHFWQLLHQNLTTNAICDCVLNYSGDLRLESNGWDRPALVSIAVETVVAGPKSLIWQHAPANQFLKCNNVSHCSTCNTLRKEFELLAFTCIPSLRCVNLENSFPPLKSIYLFILLLCGIFPINSYLVWIC